MSMLDRLPFWKRYFAELGLETVLSPVTDPRISAGGIELSVAEPCYPVQVAHGHVQALTTAGVDYIWLPVMADAEAGDDGCASHYCPWNQTLPWVLKSAPGLEAHAQKFLTPTLHFRLGPEQIKKALAETMRRRGRDAARERPRGGCGLHGAAQIPGTPDRGGAQGAGDAGEQRGAGDRAGGARIQHVRSRGELRHPAQTAAPLRRQRDPAGFPGNGNEPLSRLHANMFWISGRKILEAARIASEKPNLHMIYLTNFKCGPDSYIKHFAREAAGAPLLILQFDGHGNDAGYMTRCEAYLDSKGILRCYQSTTELPSAKLPSTPQTRPATTH